MTPRRRLDVFSHTHAQEKWESQDYQIVSNTKDINTKISAIHHSCRLVSVATVIYSGAEIHLDRLTPRPPLPPRPRLLPLSRHPAQKLSRCRPLLFIYNYLDLTSVE